MQVPSRGQCVSRNRGAEQSNSRLIFEKNQSLFIYYNNRNKQNVTFLYDGIYLVSCSWFRWYLTGLPEKYKNKF